MQGRVVLVTGAARGIGKEVARQLADLGASVLVSARKVDDARAAAKDLSAVGDVRALEVGLDVTDDTSVPRAPTWPQPTRCWRSTCMAPGGSPMPCCRCCDEATIRGS